MRASVPGEQGASAASELAVGELVERYREVRAASQALCDGLSPEDAQAQSMPEASPAKWHLAHTTWFFETLVLAEHIGGYRDFDPSFRVLFNSYYNSVGEQHPRSERGLLTRPAWSRVLEYRECVDARLVEFLGSGGGSPRVVSLVELGLHHEQQHQELLIADVKHLFSCNPLRPALRQLPAPPERGAAPLEWLGFEEGIRQVGHEPPGFSFDNEGPRHRAYLQAFEIASRPVTNGEFLAFVEDDGYQRPELWLSDGFSTARREQWRHPIYWDRSDGVWTDFTAGGRRPLNLQEPVCHVSYYEVDAYAHWSGERLPTEVEWELAASMHRGTRNLGNFIESGLLHPAPSRGTCFLGNVWEWTQSFYAPYPGYRAPQGAVGEYNGKFMANQLVLRGGSCATPAAHVRETYRNFFYPDARWQFSGVRLARDP